MKTSVTATAAATAAMAALAVSACGQNGSSDSGTASAAASASQPSTSRGSGAASSDGMMTLLPTGNLVIQVPGDAVTGATTTYDDGMQQTYYDSRGGSPLTVAVEYYAAGVKPAASVLATEQQSLTAQSIQPTVTPTEFLAEPEGTAWTGRPRRSRHGCRTVRPPRSPSRVRESSLTDRAVTVTGSMSSPIRRIRRVWSACRPSSHPWR